MCDYLACQLAPHSASDYYVHNSINPIKEFHSITIRWIAESHIAIKQKLFCKIVLIKITRPIATTVCSITLNVSASVRLGFESVFHRYINYVDAICVCVCVFTFDMYYTYYSGRICKTLRHDLNAISKRNSQMQVVLEQNRFKFEIVDETKANYLKQFVS